MRTNNEAPENAEEAKLRKLTMYDDYTFVRFLDKRAYAESFMSGKIRVGKLRHYRGLESMVGVTLTKESLA